MKLPLWRLAWRCLKRAIKVTKLIGWLCTVYATFLSSVHFGHIRLFGPVLKSSIVKKRNKMSQFSRIWYEHKALLLTFSLSCQIIAWKTALIASCAHHKCVTTHHPHFCCNSSGALGRVNWCAADLSFKVVPLLVVESLTVSLIEFYSANFSPHFLLNSCETLYRIVSRTSKWYLSSSKWHLRLSSDKIKIQGVLS